MIRSTTLKKELKDKNKKVFYFNLMLYDKLEVFIKTFILSNLLYIWIQSIFEIYVVTSLFDTHKLFKSEIK